MKRPSDGKGLFMIFYYHQHPDAQTGETVEKRAFSPLPMDYGTCGRYSDRIFNTHNSESPFYVATFGYARSWQGNNVYDRVVDRYTIHFVFGGKGLFNGKPISAGQMFFVPQNQKYTIVTDEKDPLLMSWIGISGTRLESQLQLFRLTNESTVTVFQNQEAIRQLFLDTIYQSHQNTNLEMYLIGKMFEILSLSYVVNRSFAMPTNERADVYYTNIISYINDHYSDAITVEDIAAQVHISPTYVRRICKEKTGFSPQRMISNRRMSVAKTLLANDNSSIEEIASLVGFSNIYSFSTFFKKKCGIPPGAYRRLMLEKKQMAAEKD